MRIVSSIAAALIALAALGSGAAASVRIKDVASIAGIESTQLIGYGLVVGLNGTGDGNKSVFTINSIVSMLEKLGITVAAADIRVKNVAAVMVTAELPTFAQPGMAVDVTASSLGDATSLEGGLLLMTPLRASDGLVYAVAQGAVSIGGFNVDGGAGNVVRKNHTTIGRVPGGASVSREAPGAARLGSSFLLTLDDADFQSAAGVVNEINAAFRAKVASALNARVIQVDVPEQFRANTVSFVAAVEAIEVTLDKPARVVINERTGTVVVGGEATIDEIAIAHGELKVEIKASYDVSQPFEFSDGSSIVVPEIETTVHDAAARMFAMRPSNTVSDIAAALNELGVTPRDMIAIFQALKRAGALQAELIIM
jgi:flagellar P-ring protein precursor FlgI